MGHSPENHAAASPSLTLGVPCSGSVLGFRHRTGSVSDRPYHAAAFITFGGPQGHEALPEKNYLTLFSTLVRIFAVRSISFGVMV
jgi:hypothetical protein